MDFTRLPLCLSGLTSLVCTNERSEKDQSSSERASSSDSEEDEESSEDSRDPKIWRIDAAESNSLFGTDEIQHKSPDILIFHSSLGGDTFVQAFSVHFEVLYFLIR